MNTAATPPKRRRWTRWAVVSLAVFLLGGTWWNWPREDSRFCGEWTVVDDATGTSTGRFLLSRNGQGVSIPAGTSDQWMFRWTTEDGQLVMGRGISDSFRDQLEQVSDWVLRLFGRSLLTIQLRSDVLDVQPDRIQLREHQPGGRTFTLERRRK
jgi:hypothetical protein